MYAGIWIHGQGAASALCSLMKRDFSLAVRNFLYCRCRDEENYYEQGTTRGISCRSSDGLQSSYSLDNRRRKRESESGNVQISGFLTNSSLDNILQQDHDDARIKTNSLPMSADRGDAAAYELDSIKEGIDVDNCSDDSVHMTLKGGGITKSEQESNDILDSRQHAITKRDDSSVGEEYSEDFNDRFEEFEEDLKGDCSVLEQEECSFDIEKNSAKH